MGSAIDLLVNLVRKVRLHFRGELLVRRAAETTEPFAHSGLFNQLSGFFRRRLQNSLYGTISRSQRLVSAASAFRPAGVSS